MRGNGDTKRRTIEALEAGPVSPDTLAIRLGVTVRQASSALQWLRRCGIAEMIEQKAVNRPGVWVLAGTKPVHPKVVDQAQAIT